MAYYTGPDFRTGITSLINKTTDPDTRYGERIGDDGFLRKGPFTMDFLDSDGDGIDDRQQAGPGKPEIGSKSDESPIFDGGGNPISGGGGGGDGGGGDGSPFGKEPFDPLNSENNSSNFFDGFDFTNFSPTYQAAKLLGKGIGAFEEKFFPEAVKDFIAKNSPEAIKQRYGNYMDKYGTEQAPQDIEYDFNPKVSFNEEQIAGLANKYGLTGSYGDQIQAAQDFTQSNIDKKEALALGLEERIGNYPADFPGMVIDDGYSPGFPSNPLSDISNYTLAELEDKILGIDMSMTNQYNDAIREQEAREAREAQAEQDRINNAVASGYLGFGLDEYGNYEGVVTDGTGAYVNTGYNPNVQNENYHNMFSQAEKDIANSQSEAQQGFEQAQTSVAEQAEQNKQRREKNKNQGNNSGGGGNSGGGSRPGAGAGTGGCFIKGTMIEMADGTEKEITSINVGEETKGGTVEAKLEFMPHNIYDYKGVKVSGSHWVMEDNQFTEVENSKHGVLTDIIEPVYNFITSKHRIFIKGVEFGGFYSQDPNNYEPYFKQEKIKINKELSEKTT